MKALSVVCKIDSAGRIYIPKEIRKINKWDEGTPLTAYIDFDGSVILKRYQPSLSS